ncbi:dynamin family protein [Metarhizium robertsii ARSEF 23]|uniref:Dynamin family protein n=1 Tax=Metarhizium robertsii (strain ARSEF 23 / ATCC MYA-3075) TaxID=655844 RepID=E9FDN5_METRA|nr:dynamin family protein [Metarhizium robertsii ARSEF 23]EFY94148.1 dynamin family protein [Metarhizium robertsii ARSEF 23]
MRTIALQSPEHRNLLDVIDKLRSRGLGKYVDLPEIVVCGDQSAGKSSVLEAISGMTFPTKDNLCTRFPTELILRRHAQNAVKISINPDPERSAEEKAQLRRFSVDTQSSEPDIGTIVEKAKEAMNLSETRKFSTDVLRIELCGPVQPHLTMVDLPGLFRAGNRGQSAEDALIVSKMVRDYVKRPRSIILAVVSAKSDFALQEITEMARELDPHGLRTLGLITKPDTLDSGSDSEAAYIRLAQNQDVFFRLGWHVLKNRDFKMRHASSNERDEAEEAFFSAWPWAALDNKYLGVKSLRPKLSNVLKDQILQQLPSFVQDIDIEITNCRNHLNRLGTARTTPAEQRRYLFQVSRDFTAIMRAAVDGEYNNVFFGSSKTDEGYRRRLRARVQESLTVFAENVRQHGQNKIIVDSEDEAELSGRQITRSSYMGEVKDLMRRSRGRELPGTFNPLIIGELFIEQCQPWDGIAADVKSDVLRIVYEVAKTIVEHVAVEETAERILQVINTAISSLGDELDSEFQLLLPSRAVHPITYNHYLTDTVQKIQEDRRRHKLREGFRTLMGDDEISPVDQNVYMNPSALISQLEDHTEVDMESYACSLAIDYAEAYYKSDAVFGLDDEETLRLAGESEYSTSERRRIKEKLAVLEGSKAELRRLNVHHSPACPSSSPYEDKITEDSTQTINEVEVEDRDSGKMTADQTQDGQVETETHVDSVQNDVSSGRYHSETIDLSFQQDIVDDFECAPSRVKKYKKKKKKNSVADDGQRDNVGHSLNVVNLAPMQPPTWSD